MIALAFALVALALVVPSYVTAAGTKTRMTNATIRVGDVELHMPAFLIFAAEGVDRIEPGGTYGTNLVAFARLPAADDEKLPMLPEGQVGSDIREHGRLSLRTGPTARLDTALRLEAALADDLARPLPNAPSTDELGQAFYLNDLAAFGEATARRVQVPSHGDASFSTVIVCGPPRINSPRAKVPSRFCEIGVAVSRKVVLTYKFYDDVWPERHWPTLARIIADTIDRYITNPNARSD